MSKTMVAFCALNLLFSALLISANNETEAGGFNFQNIIKKLESFGNDLFIPGLKTLMSTLFGKHTATKGHEPGLETKSGAKKDESKKVEDKKSEDKKNDAVEITNDDTTTIMTTTNDERK